MTLRTTAAVTLLLSLLHKCARNTPAADPSVKRLRPHKAMQASLQQHCRAIPTPILNPPRLLLTHRLLKPIPGLPGKIKPPWHPNLTLLLLLLLLLSKLLSKLLLYSFMGGVNLTVRVCFDWHGWGWGRDCSPILGPGVWIPRL